MTNDTRSDTPHDTSGCPPSEYLAKQYIDAGLIPIPFKLNSAKQPKLKGEGAVDKYVEEFLEAEDKLEVFKKHCGDCCNIGIVLDRTLKEGYKVLLVDIDNFNPYSNTQSDRLRNLLGDDLINTFVVKTPRGIHLHYLYKSDKTFSNKQGIEVPGVGRVDILFAKTTPVPPTIIVEKKKDKEGKEREIEKKYEFMSFPSEIIEVDPEEILEKFAIEEEEKEGDVPYSVKLIPTGDIDWDKLKEIIAEVYQPGRRNLIEHALVGVLYRQGVPEDKIMEFVHWLTELDRAQGERDTEIRKRIMDAKNVIRFCRSEPEKCPSLRRLKEVLKDELGDEKWRELLRALGFRRKSLKYLLKDAGSIRVSVVAGKDGVWEVIQRFVTDVENKKRKIVYRSEKKNLSKSILLDVSKGMLKHVEGEFVYLEYVNGSRRAVAVPMSRLKEFISTELKEMSPSVAQKVKDLIVGSMKGKVIRYPVSGAFPGGKLIAKGPLWLGDGDQHVWKLPNVEPADGRIVKEVLWKLRKICPYEVPLEAIAWVLTAIYRLELKQHAVDVPALALVGPRSTGKSYLADVLRDMFDLRIEAAKTEPQLRRAMSRSAVPFILDEAMPDSEKFNDWLETLKMAVANRDLLLRRIDVRNQYGGDYYAFSIPLMTLNRFPGREDILDKIAFIFVDGLTPFVGELSIDREELLRVGRRLVEDFREELQTVNWKGLPYRRSERYYELFRVAKRVVCRYVGCSEEPLHLALDIDGINVDSPGEGFRAFLMHRVVITDTEVSFGTVEGWRRVGIRQNVARDRLGEVFREVWYVELRKSTRVAKLETERVLDFLGTLF